ncbi:MAG: HD domain-containing protein [Desulfobacterales bacterium]|nr:HD domain-containing protein [Desulfobacterales bacterium]
MNNLRQDQIDRSMLLNQCLEALSLVLEYNMKAPAHLHAIRVGEGCVVVGEKMGISPKTLQKLYYAGLLHDVGKVSIDPRIHSKHGKLSQEEFEIIKKHTVHGSRILASLPGLNQLALWTRWHHEWWDGSGYPDGLHKDEIPIEAQIMGIMDSFDILHSPRYGREQFTEEQIIDIFIQEQGKHFNSSIVDLVIEMMKKKNIVFGETSQHFIELKEKYINIPLVEYTNEYWKGTGMAGLYPILHLFARVIDANHKYTRGHSTRVSILSKYIAEKMNLQSEDIIKVEVAGLLHDAGKVSVPIEILDKPGRPTDEEWEIIKGHPGHSYDIMTKISALNDIAEISAAHHERFDGKGYPNKLKGNQINILAQIISIADTYDAITSTRSYREGQPPEFAFKIIKEGLGTQFNPEIAKIFLDTYPKYIKALLDMYETT